MNNQILLGSSRTLEEKISREEVARAFLNCAKGNGEANYVKRILNRYMNVRGKNTTIIPIGILDNEDRSAYTFNINPYTFMRTRYGKKFKKEDAIRILNYWLAVLNNDSPFYKLTRTPILIFVKRFPKGGDPSKPDNWNWKLYVEVGFPTCPYPGMQMFKITKIDGQNQRIHLIPIGIVNGSGIMYSIISSNVRIYVTYVARLLQLVREEF